jgi:hypothetical protein
MPWDIRNTSKGREKSPQEINEFITEPVQYYMREKKRREFGLRMLDLAGKVRISGDALRHIEEGRDDLHNRLSSRKIQEKRD